VIVRVMRKDHLLMSVTIEDYEISVYFVESLFGLLLQ
jgi:hypothetical protein